MNSKTGVVTFLVVASVLGFGFSYPSQHVYATGTIETSSSNNAKDYVEQAVKDNWQNKHAMALDLVNRAIALNPNYAKAYNVRGWIYISQDKYDLAFSDFNHAIKLDPNYGEPFNNRGNIYQHQGKYELALIDYKHALKLMPDSYKTKVHCNIGDTYMFQKKYDAALQEYNRAIELDSNNKEAIIGRGKLYKLIGKDSLANADFARAKSLK